MATFDALAQVGLWLAQATTTTATSQPAQAAPWWARLLANPLPILIVVFALMMVMMSRSRQKQEKQKRALLDQIKRGDRVQTIGGILGNVVEVRDDRVLLKVDESNNTKVWFSRTAIHRVLDEETAKAETK